MRISLVNQYFPPDTSATAEVFADLVEELLEAGHEVEVLAGRPSYNPSRTIPWRPWSTERRGSLTIERVGSSSFPRLNSWGRRFNYISYLAIGALRSLRRSAADVVVAGSDPPMSIWLAHRRARGRPIVYSLQDLHPDAALTAGLIEPSRATRWWEKTHLKALCRANVVVCIGRDMARRLQTKGVPPRQIRVIPNGTRLVKGQPSSVVVDELRGSSDFVAMHAGNLGTAGAWETLATAAGRLASEGIDLLFVGEGLYEGALRAADVRVIPFRAADEIPSVMAAGDIQIVTMRQGMEGLVVPSKIYTILAHGRPVFGLVPEGSEVASIIKEYDCGLLADPSSPDDVVEKLVWARRNPDALRAMGRAAESAAAHYDRARCRGAMAKLIEETAATTVR